MSRKRSVTRCRFLQRTAAKRLLLCVALGLIVPTSASGVSSAADHWLVIEGGEVTVGVNKDLSLKVYKGGGGPVWTTSESSTPAVTVQTTGDGETKLIPLGRAADRAVEPFDDGTHRGHRMRLRGLPGADAEMELVLALSSSGELLVEVEQVGGSDTVQRVAHLYSWSIEPAADAYVVVPHGSGYLIRSDSPKPVHTSGFVGAAYSLPMFGIVQGDKTCYQIIETWWDARVSVKHTPGQGTVLSLDWEASLGKLRYPRRVLFRFAEKLDYVGMAKAYRRYLIDRGELTTLEQRARGTPALKHYLAGVEYRWVGWEPDQNAQALDNIRRFKKAGLPVTFFFPKWPAAGNIPGKPADGGWQGYLQPEPVSGGWAEIKNLEDAAHRLGCAVKLMVNPTLYLKDAPAYDPAKLSGVRFPSISSHWAVRNLKLMLDNLERKGVRIEAMYMDGYSAFDGHAEHNPAEGGPVSRKQAYESQIDCFREIRRHGITPGAELARFWSVGPCDYFFFTDWARDRLRNGEPVPLFPLVFHDCYAAHFSGGGYYNEGKHDWYADRHPRLYELMYAAMPSHNWLPGGSRHIEPDDWDTVAMNRRLEWLRRWHVYYQKVCYSEMLTHKFLNPERTLQRVEFAGGVVADFDLDRGLYRVQGVPGFSGVSCAIRIVPTSDQ